VDIDAGIITRCRAKTGGASLIPMHAQLNMHLRTLPLREKGGDVMPGIAATYRKDQPKISRAVSLVFRDAGVLKTETGDVGFTSFRVTFASRMQDEGGVAPNVLKAATGHSSEAMLRSHYTRADEDRLRAAVEKLERVG
jgi:integrase